MGHPLKTEEHASAVLAGGIANHGYQCGMVWGASLAAGAQAYQVFGAGPTAETAAVLASRRIIDSFSRYNRAKAVDCLAISGLNMREKFKARDMLRYIFTGRMLRCFTMTPGIARASIAEIDAVYASPPADVPSPPVSCSALLVRKAGFSDQHIVMAAGLAGGIGLSGSGCGALGAAIWAYALKHSIALGLKADPHVKSILDLFSSRFGPDFTCSGITGRKFENVRDHAEFLRQGGCSELITLLASAVDGQANITV